MTASASSDAPAQSGPVLFFSSSVAPWLLLAGLPKFGSRLQRAVLSETPMLTDVLTMNAATLMALGFTSAAAASIQAWQRHDTQDPVVVRARDILHRCEHLGIGILTPDSACYPEALKHIHDAPLVLYTLGNPELLARDQIGVIGSRNATRAGLDHARRFSAELSARNLIITSGLALGIDGAAHSGALDAGFPTIAVIGSGLDRIYPAQHSGLSERIAGQGVLVSEYPPGTPARAGHFPRRNRIISGLSRGILVVEAGMKSGSLITARLALEQGREVFAIPGSVHSPVAKGCHHLIRQGAQLVETADHILEELGTWWSLHAASADKPVETTPELPDMDSREIAVFEALGYDPQSTDALSSVTGLPADQLMQSLLLLELQGLVSSAPGGFQRIT